MELLKLFDEKITLGEVLNQLDIQPADMQSTSPHLDMSQEFELGCQVHTSRCYSEFKYFDLVEIMPNMAWTSGVIKPDYCNSYDGNITLYLNKILQSTPA